MNLRLVVLFVIAPILWVALHLYMGRRLIGGSRFESRFVDRGGWAVVVAFALVPPLVFLTMRGGGGQFEGLQWLGFVMMGGSSVVLVLLLGVDGIRFARLVLHRFRTMSAPPDSGRRAFLGRAVNVGIAGGAGTVVTVGVVQAQQLPQISEVDVPLVGLPASLEGFRIAQISDVHVGPTIHGDFLAAVVEQVNALNPDVIAVTGDLIDGWVDDLRVEVAALAKLRARHGAFFVTGNHEYYWDGPAWCEEVRRLGLTVLNNTHQIIEHDGARLLLAGVTDYTAGSMVRGHTSDPAAACRGSTGHSVKVLLAHQPRSIYAAAASGYDLQISGHTHGGQYFPMNLLIHLAQPYVAGLERHDNTWIYVSRGTGYWGPPLRVGAPHEITLLRLTAGS